MDALTANAIFVGLPLRCAVFDVEVAYRDPGLAALGLQKAVLPIGRTFLGAAG